VLKVARK